MYKWFKYINPTTETCSRQCATISKSKKLLTKLNKLNNQSTATTLFREQPNLTQTSLTTAFRLLPEQLSKERKLNERKFSSDPCNAVSSGANAALWVYPSATFTVCRFCFVSCYIGNFNYPLYLHHRKPSFLSSRSPLEAISEPEIIILSFSGTQLTGSKGWFSLAHKHNPTNAEAVKSW